MTSNKPSHLLPEQWKEDLKFFQSEVPIHHKNAFHTISKAQFHHAVAAFETKIPFLKDHEIVVGFQRLAAMIGDGHTFVATWDLHHIFPFELFWFGRELRVIRASQQYAEVLGAKICKIGTMSIADVHREIRKAISQRENRWYVQHQSAQQIIQAEVLAALEIVPEVDHAVFTFKDANAQSFSRTIHSVAPAEDIQWVSALMEPPLYMQRPADPFWFTYLPDAQTVYVNFRSYQALEEKASELFQYIDCVTPNRLVIDLRQNGGGNYDLARRHLIYPIQFHPTLNNTGRLFVIIGRGTFSAAMSNATDFRRETDAILTGEPTGGRPNSYQENHWLTLPNSGLRVSVAKLRYRFADQNIPAVMPDHNVIPTWEDFQMGRDAVMDWILNQPYPCSQ